MEGIPLSLNRHGSVERPGNRHWYDAKYLSGKKSGEKANLVGTSGYLTDYSSPEHENSS